MKAKSECSIPDCTDSLKGRGWCNRHWISWKKYGDPLFIDKARQARATAECESPSCTENAKVKGLCRKHYGMKLKTGRIEKILSSKGERLEWIKNIVNNPTSECAIFYMDDVGDDRYRWVEYENRCRTAHRVALILHSGIDPADLFAAHGPCHNKSCCNPLHLSWKTPKENSLDRVRDGTHIKGEDVSSSVLKEPQAMHILEMKGLLSLKELGDIHEVNPSTVWSVQSGKNWGWLQDEHTVNKQETETNEKR